MHHHDPGSDKPIAKSVFVGRSDSFSYEEALRSALGAASPGGADQVVPFVIQRVYGQHGGPTGERCLCVEIRLDEEAGQDIPGGLLSSRPAQSLSLLTPAIESIELGVISSQPPQFVLRGQRQMPTPGWTFHIDRVHSEAASGRILVELTDVPPEGMAVSVVGPTPISVQLGALRAGRHVVEIHARRSPHERHQLLQAVVVEAT